jgi:hypothetical protein
LSVIEGTLHKIRKKQMKHVTEREMKRLNRGQLLEKDKAACCEGGVCVGKGVQDGKEENRFACSRGRPPGKKAAA